MAVDNFFECTKEIESLATDVLHSLPATTSTINDMRGYDEILRSRDRQAKYKESIPHSLLFVGKKCHKQGEVILTCLWQRNPAVIAVGYQRRNYSPKICRY